MTQREALTKIRKFVSNARYSRKSASAQRLAQEIADNINSRYNNKVLNVNGMERCFLKLVNSERKREGYLRLIARFIILQKLYNEAESVLKRKTVSKDAVMSVAEKIDTTLSNLGKLNSDVVLPEYYSQ